MSYTQQAGVIGIGQTTIERRHHRSAHELAIDAFRAAIEDAGIDKSQVDGLMSFSFGVDYDRLLESFGIDVRYAFQGWHHGRFVVPFMAQAALAIDSGMANVVALVFANKRKDIGKVSSDAEMWRQGLGPHGESPAYGAVSRAYAAAIATQRYFHMYGGDNSSLAPVATSLRYNASRNPNAVRREPLTTADHQSSPWVVEPLRLLDCCQVTEGATCILVANMDLVKDGKQPPVQILGMQGSHAGPQYHNFAQPGLGVAQQDVFKYEPDDLTVYDMAGVKREEVDGVTVYDAFSSTVLWSLERFGFCGPGEAMDFVRDGRIQVGGELPVNSSGGLLSEGHLAGWNLLTEMVLQLRGQAPGAQIENCEILQWASFLGDSLIMSRPR